MEEELEAAAVTMQAAFRGKAARREVKALREQRIVAETKEQERAAAAMQSAYRGRVARKQVDALREERAAAPTAEATVEAPAPATVLAGAAAAALQSPFAARLAAKRAERAAAEARARERAELAEAEAEVKARRKRTEREASARAESEAAALRREEAATVAAEAVKAEATRRAREDEVALEVELAALEVEVAAREVERDAAEPEGRGRALAEDTPTDEERAAVAMQAVYRGKAARQRVEALRAEHAERQEQESAAVAMQAAFRGKVARRQVEALLEERGAAAAAVRKPQMAAETEADVVHSGASATENASHVPDWMVQLAEEASKQDLPLSGLDGAERHGSNAAPPGTIETAGDKLMVGAFAIERPASAKASEVDYGSDDFESDFESFPNTPRA